LTRPSIATLLTEISALEHRVWQALVDGDAAADASLLSDDFLGVYSDGFAGKFDHTGQLKEGPTIKQFSIDAPILRTLGADHAIFSYRALFQRIDRSTAETMYVTSIWQRCDAGWINIFSQDTPEQI
jgi:hypothetical protein